jgi:hypothetical protein
MQPAGIYNVAVSHQQVPVELSGRMVDEMKKIAEPVARCLDASIAYVTDMGSAEDESGTLSCDSQKE